MLPEIETERLLLRVYRAEDRDARHALLHNPGVTRFFPSSWVPPTHERIAAGIVRHGERWQRFGFGEWAVVLKEEGRVIGYCGLQHVPDTPGDIEVLYGFAPEYWGRGLATEAARAALRFGFEEAKLPRIVAAVDPRNHASQHVLEKLGMTYDPDTHYYFEYTKCYYLSREAYRPDDSVYVLRYVE